MDENSTNLLDSIVNNTDSVLIAFFAVLIVALIPLYVFILNNRKHTAKIEKERLEQESNRQDKYMERESRIIGVITNNSEVISKLCTILEKDGQTNTQSISRVHDIVGDQNKLLISNTEILTRISTVLDESLRNQGVMKDDIRTIMLKSYTGNKNARKIEQGGTQTDVPEDDRG